MPLEPLDTSLLARGVPAPQFRDPLEQMSRGLEIRQQQANLGLAPLRAQQMQAETGLAQSQMQEQQGIVQRQNEDNQDDQTFHQAFIDNEGDWDKTLSQTRGQMHARNAQKYEAQNLESKRALFSAGQDKRAALKAEGDIAGEGFLGVVQAPDEAKQDLWTAAKQRLQRGGYDASQYPDAVPNDQTVRAYIALNNHGKELVDWADKKAQEDSRRETAARTKVAADRQRIQEKKEDAVDEYASVADQEGHDAWLQKWKTDPDIGSRIGGFKQYNDQTKAAIQDMALTPEQRTQKAERDSTAKMTQQARDEQKRKDAIAQQRADANDRRIDALVAGGGNRPATRGQFANVEVKKDQAIRQSKTKLDKDLAANSVQGKMIDPDAAETAWQEHIDRLKEAQNAYEAEISSLSGKAEPHNDWADRLQAPSFAKPATAQSKNVPQPSQPAPVQPKQQKQGASVLTEPPVSMLTEGLETTFKGDRGTWTLKDGKPVKIR